MAAPKPHDEARALVAQNLRRLLAEHEMTVHALAAKAGVDRSNLYEVLKKNRGVTVDILGHLAEALGIEVGEFLRGV